MSAAAGVLHPYLESGTCERRKSFLSELVPSPQAPQTFTAAWKWRHWSERKPAGHTSFFWRITEWENGCEDGPVPLDGGGGSLSPPAKPAKLSWVFVRIQF